jgi:hypothetical protein
MCARLASPACHVPLRRQPSRQLSTSWRPPRRPAASAPPSQVPQDGGCGQCDHAAAAAAADSTVEAALDAAALNAAALVAAAAAVRLAADAADSTVEAALDAAVCLVVEVESSACPCVSGRAVGVSHLEALAARIGSGVGKRTFY